MEVVIKIPNEYAKQFYENKCKDKFDNLATNEFGYVLRKAFEKGTPLPEHHGRIIDESQIKHIECHTEQELYGAKIRYVKATDAPTIIERSDSECQG